MAGVGFGCGRISASAGSSRAQGASVATANSTDYQAKIFFWRDTPKARSWNSSERRSANACGKPGRFDHPFQLKSFRSGPSNEVQLIGRAPECHIDSAGHRAWDKGPIVLFTPTTNVWIQGEGFLFVETNHSLDISNKVETRVLRSLLKTTALNGAKTNTPGASEQMFENFCGPRSFRL